MHCHKLIKETLDTVKIVKSYAGAKKQRKGHFGKFVSRYGHGSVEDEPLVRFKKLRCLWFPLSVVSI